MTYKELLGLIGEYSKGRKDFIYGLDGLKFYNKVAIGRGMYILVGGQSGSGKTSFVDTVFILNIYANRTGQGKPVPLWIYNSLERHKEAKLAKWAALMCFWENHMIDVPTILNLPNKKRNLNKEDFRMLDEVSEVMTDIEDNLIFYEAPMTVDQQLKNCIDVAQGRGKLITTDGSIKVNGKKVADFGDNFIVKKGAKRRVFNGRNISVTEGETLYIPNNPEEIVMTITDHLGKLGGPFGVNTKKTIDNHADNQGFIRDCLKWCPIDVSQFNRDSQDTKRNLKMDLDVKEADFKNSSTPFENADLVLGLINPHKLGHTRYGDIKVKDLVAPTGENRLRVLKIVKNSYGSDDMQMPLLFLGENGFVDDLPYDLSDFSNKYNYESIREL